MKELRVGQQVVVKDQKNPFWVGTLLGFDEDTKEPIVVNDVIDGAMPVRCPSIVLPYTAGLTTYLKDWDSQEQWNLLCIIDQQESARVDGTKAHTFIPCSACGSLSLYRGETDKTCGRCHGFGRVLPQSDICASLTRDRVSKSVITFALDVQDKIRLMTAYRAEDGAWDSWLVDYYATYGANDWKWLPNFKHHAAVYQARLIIDSSDVTHTCFSIVDATVLYSFMDMDVK
jgi:hypothetical protein